MTRYSPLWQQANVYPAAQDRQLLGALWPIGAASGTAATLVAGTMNVSIPAGTLAVPLQAGQGTVLCRWDAAEIVTLAAAPPAGQSRIDLIICQVRDNVLDAGPNNDFIFTSVTGTATSGTPAVPATPTNAIAVNQVLVPGNVTNLNTATITDLRPTRGLQTGIIPVTDSKLLAADYSVPAAWGTWMTTNVLGVGTWLIFVTTATTVNAGNQNFLQTVLGTAVGTLLPLAGGQEAAPSSGTLTAQQFYSVIAVLTGAGTLLHQAQNGNAGFSAIHTTAAGYTTGSGYTAIKLA